MMNRLFKKTMAVMVAVLLLPGLSPLNITAEAVHTEDVTKQPPLEFTPHPRYWDPFGRPEEGQVIDLNVLSSVGPRAVSNEINAFLAETDEGVEWAVLEIPYGVNHLSLNPDSLNALITADTGLAVISGDAAVNVRVEKLEEILEQLEHLWANIRITGIENADGNVEVSVNFCHANGRSIGGLDTPAQVVVDLSDRDVMYPNPYRVVALDRGRRSMPIGGTYNPGTGLFTVDVTGSTTFTIEMADDLVRLRMSPGSTMLTDLAGNVPNVRMEAAPIIRDGIVLVPVRYVGEALGFGVDWNPDTREVTLSQDERTFTFGTDHPQAQLIDDKAFITLDYAGQLFGAFVRWDEASRTIKVVR